MRGSGRQRADIPGGGGRLRPGPVRPRGPRDNQPQPPVHLCGGGHEAQVRHIGGVGPGPELHRDGGRPLGARRPGHRGDVRRMRRGPGLPGQHRIEARAGRLVRGERRGAGPRGGVRHVGADCRVRAGGDPVPQMHAGDHEGRGGAPVPGRLCGRGRGHAGRRGDKVPGGPAVGGPGQGRDDRHGLLGRRFGHDIPRSGVPPLRQTLTRPIRGTRTAPTAGTRRPPCRRCRACRGPRSSRCTRCRRRRAGRGTRPRPCPSCPGRR